MFFGKWVIKFSSLLCASAFIFLIGWSPTAAQNEGNSFLAPLPQGRAANSISIDPLATQQRFVSFNPTRLATRSASPLTLDLFDEKKVEIKIDRLDQSVNGGQLLVGRAVGFPLSNVTITWQENVAAGTIHLGQEIYRLRHVENGTHILEQLPNEYLPSGEPIVPTNLKPKKGETRAAEVELADASESEQVVSVDVLVLYTQLAEQAMGGATGTQNTIDLAIEESNNGFTQSGIHVQFDLVHSHKVEFVESKKSFSTMLSSLQKQNDGTLDYIHALRDFYGADIVTMIVNRPLLCGSTYQNIGGNTDFSPFAFSVLHHSCTTGYYSFAHEIGHNMGSQHNVSESNQLGAFDYSYGYQDPANRYRTIMAYNCPMTCLRINHWSNPAIDYQGMGPTGRSFDSEHGADNHRSLSQMAPSVAAFRQSKSEEVQSIEVQFQPAGTQLSEDLLEGVLIDSGKPFQPQRDQLTYGWNADFSKTNLHKSSTYILAVAEEGKKAVWEILVPNGLYQIKLVSGDPQTGLQPAGLLIEDDMITNKHVTTNPATLFEIDTVITVNDGFLTISGVNHETVLNSLEITPISVSSSNLTATSEHKLFLPIISN